MPQDRTSGAAANRWGRETAKRLAAALDASPIRPGSNECIFNDERVVIKCAAANTDSVGVTYHMLKRLKYVLGAFELDDGSFELRSLTVPDYQAAMTPTRSLGASGGRVGIVKRSVFLSRGRMIRRVRV